MRSVFVAQVSNYLRLRQNFHPLVYGPLLLFTLLTGGCGTLSNHNGFSHQGDGAPSQTIDLAKIPDAEPRIAPYSRYGNPESYVVNGHRYQVLNNSSKFEQHGIASWYGTKFHGQRTSSGEPYDMYAMTAAHKTLPLPTWLEVINLNNGKHVIVKVNDRGPFIDNRILDLSYVAAAKLGITATGTAPVTIRAIDPSKQLPRKKPTPVKSVIATATTHGLKAAPVTQLIKTPTLAAGTTLSTTNISSAKTTKPSSTTTVPSSRKIVTPATAGSDNSQSAIKGFYLQIAAFNERRNAELLKDKLLALQHSSAQIDFSPRSGNPNYRVRIGPLSSLSEAGKLAAQISSLGLGSPKILLD